MVSWPVYLTAENASAKALNKAWIQLQDYGYTDSNDDGSWVLLTSKTLPAEPPETTRQLPVDESYHNHSLANATLEELNNFIRTHESELRDLDISADIWVVLDQKGLETATCILAERLFDEDKMEMADGFRAMRISLPETWACYVNLDIANMGFEDFADLDAGVQEDGLFKWVGPFKPSNEGLKRSKNEQDGKREAAMKAARDLGYID